MLKKQRGATFVGWLTGAGLFIFLAIMAVKLVPLYLHHESVKKIIDQVAADDAMRNANKKRIMDKINRFLDINSLDDYLDSENFDVVKPKGSKKRQLTVNYEARTPWISNLEFVAKFKYTREMGKSIE